MPAELTAKQGTWNQSVATATRQSPPPRIATCSRKANGNTIVPSCPKPKDLKNLPSRLLKNSMSTVEGGRIGDGKPSSASHESLLGLPDAIDFSHFRKDRVFQQPARAKSAGCR